MALDLLAIISAAGTGAVTGYLTNNLALKMIFKEYGPLGGVVIKTKDEFIDSISALVERDLINHHTLEAEFTRPEFKENFAQSVSDFLNVYLEQRSSKTRIAQIPAWKENYQLLASFMGESSVEILAESSNLLSEEELEQLLSKSELEDIIREIYYNLIKKAKKRGSLEKILLSLYDQLQDQNLNQILSQESQKKVKDFIKEILSYFKNNYQSLEANNKEQFKERLQKLFDLENLSQNLITEIKELKVSNLFKEKDELKELLDAELYNILKEIMLNFKIEIDNSNLMIEDILNSDLEEELISELTKIITSAETEILGFLNEEEDELNDLILEAVEAEIADSNGLKAMSRQGIYSKYQENIDEYGLPLTHLKDFLKTKLASDKQELAIKFMDEFKSLRVSKLLQNFDLEEAAASIEAYIWDFYDQIEDKKLLDLFTEEVFADSLLEDKIIEFIFTSLKNVSADQESVDLLLDYGLGFNLNKLISKEEITEKIEKITAKAYQIFTESDFLVISSAEFLNQKFFSLLNQEINTQREKFQFEAEDYFKQFESDLGKKELSDFYSLVEDEPETVVKLTESISAFFYNNLPELIEGKIAQAASTNLHQLSDQEVQAAIEDCMGKELKPITYLGALLGATAGIIFTLSGAEAAIFNTAPVWVDYLISALLYGGVGWLTNVLAIWMIFHPYQQKELAGVRIPFTPGVVAKNRSRFADSMGRFVEKELLKANSAADIIEKNRSEIKNQALKYFEESDYQQFFALLKDNNQFLAETAVKKLDKTLSDIDLSGLEKEDLRALINPLVDKMDKFLTKKLSGFDLAAFVKEYLSNNKNSFEQFNKLIISSLDIEKITSAAAGSYQVDLNSNQIKGFLQNKEFYPLFKFLVPALFEKEISFDFKNYVLESLNSNSEHYLNRSLELLYQQQETAARLINFKKDEIIEAEKEKKGGLLKNTLISGAIYMADLDEFVDSVTERVFIKLRENYFVEKRDKLEKKYDNLMADLENKDILKIENLKINETLKKFFSSEKGSSLLTEIIYLSDQEINKFIDLTLKAEKEKLLSFELQINKEEIDYFINQQLSLEQKLKLLLSVKKIFKSENIEREILSLIDKNNLKFINLELAELIQETELIKSDFISPELLQLSKENLVSLIEKQEFNDLLVSEISDKIIELAELLEKELNPESLAYLLDLIVESGVDSFKANSEALFKSLELKELTASEVRKMNPAEIEEVFDSFAGKYFAHLKQYGWFGGAFGVLQLLLRSLV